MRFHVPNNELDIYLDEKEAEKAKKKAEKKKTAGEEEKKDGDDGDDDDSSSEGEEMTAAKLFDQKIHKKANIGEFAGEIVASI